MKMAAAQRHTHKEAMLSVEQAQDRILGFFQPLEAVNIPLSEATGTVLTEDIISDLNVPPLDNSAMDGYAVQSQSVSGASRSAPKTLRVVGTIAAGQLPRIQVKAGAAVRIMTGAPVPKGADAIVPFEDTDEIDRRQTGKTLREISVKVGAEPGSHVRTAGRDITKGQAVLKAGTVLGPAQIGLIASMGQRTAKVHRRPVVSILATGDELVDPGGPLPAGRIYDSNSHSVATAVALAGGVPRLIGIARDNLGEVGRKLNEGLASDLLVTSAGVSKGDFDIVKDVLANRGAMEFWSVRMRPAKPLAFGKLKLDDASDRTVPHLGLPGNPVSALIAFEHFGRPAIIKMLGRQPAPRPTIRAILTDSIVNSDGRRVFARVVVTKRNGKYYASLTGDQSSNLLTSMAQANGLAICPEELQAKKAGEETEVLMMNWPPEVF